MSATISSRPMSSVSTAGGAASGQAGWGLPVTVDGVTVGAGIGKGEHTVPPSRSPQTAVY